MKTNKITEAFNSVIISATAIYILFHAFFEVVFTKLFVSSFFQYCSTQWYNDAVVFLIVLLGVMAFCKSYKQFVLSPKYSIIILIVTVIYLFYRYDETVWRFTRFFFVPFLNYADAFCVIPVLILTQRLLFWISNNKSIKQHNLLFNDVPLGMSRPDELGFENYSKQVANVINNSEFNQSFAIGINGKWGMGKTSFIDLIKRDVRKTDTILIDFNPWNSSTPEAISKDFFTTIQEHFDTSFGGLNALLNKYANKVSSDGGGTVVSLLFHFFNKDASSTKQLYDRINKLFKQYGKRIIVFVDDLDRLDDKELLEVLRLIRNTANFHNTVFIAAYDKNYVSSAVSRHNEYNSHLYVDKIFQLEITLPYFDKTIYREKICKNLSTIFSNQYLLDIENIILKDAQTAILLNDNWIESIRDVTKLSNQISLNFQSLKGEVEFRDFFLLELLHLKYPVIYEALFTNVNLYFEAKEVVDRNHLYVLKKNDKNEFVINSLCKDLNLHESDTDRIFRLLEVLFPERIYDLHSRHLSIAIPSNFNKYFSFYVSAGQLSYIEFSSVLTRSIDEIKVTLQKWVNNGWERELRFKFESIKAFDNREDFEKKFTALFYLGSIPSSFYKGFGIVVGYSLNDILNKTTYNKELASFYKGTGEKDALKQFVLKLFNEAVPPYSFESNVLQEWSKLLDTDKLLLNKKECLDINTNYLRNYCEQQSVFDRNILPLLFNSMDTTWIEQGNNTYKSSKELDYTAVEVFLRFISQKDLNGFLINIITARVKVDTYSLYNETVLSIWGSWDQFEKFISEQEIDKWEYLEEFSKFYQEYKSNSYLPIVFSFNVMNK